MDIRNVKKRDGSKLVSGKPSMQVKTKIQFTVDGHQLLSQFISYLRKLNAKIQIQVNIGNFNFLVEYLIKSVKVVKAMVNVIFITMISENLLRIVQKNFFQHFMVGQIINMTIT